MPALFQGHKFAASPLSLGVPLDGADTVLGLREIERLQRNQKLRSAFSVTEGPAKCYERYKGPYLHELTTSSLSRPPKPWLEFFHGGEDGSWRGSYNIPWHTLMLQERMEENTVYYLPNYLRVAGAVLLLVLYLHPIALVGIACVGGAMAINAMYLSPSSESAEGDTWGSLRAMLTLAAYIIMIYTRCLGVLLRTASLSGCIVGLHMALRRTLCEHRHRGPRPGVSLLAVVGWEPVPPGMDPRRLFKELGMAAWRMGVGLAEYAWLCLAYSCRDWWRYSRWPRW